MKRQPRNTKDQMARYVLVSVIAAMADYILLMMLMEVVMAYIMPHIHAYTTLTETHMAYFCQIVSSLLSGLINFWLSSTSFVFGKAQTKSSTWGFILFTLIGAGYLGIQMLCIKVGDVIGCPLELSKAIGIVLGFLWNFYGRKRLVFKQRK